MTPTCPNCRNKFPGDPCRKCGLDSVTAVKHKAHLMPAATRRRKKHGRA